MNSPKHPFKTFSRNPTQLGLRSMWRSVISTTIRAAVPSWSSESRSQYQDFQSWSVLERRSSTDRRAYDGSSYLSSRVVQGNNRRITQVRDDGVHDGPSWPWRSVETMTVRRVIRRPNQFLSKIVLLLKPTKQVVTVLGFTCDLY